MLQFTAIIFDLHDLSGEYLLVFVHRKKRKRKAGVTMDTCGVSPEPFGKDRHLVENIRNAEKNEVIGFRGMCVEIVSTKL